MGDFTVMPLDRETALRLDALWPALRPADAPHARWRWTELQHMTTLGLEAFWILDDERRAVAAWVGERQALVRDPAVVYELCYLEVDPSRLREGLGEVAIELVLDRAKHLGCVGVVLGAFEEVAGFYERLGARRCPPPPPRWRPERGLTGFYLDHVFHGAPP